MRSTGLIDIYEVQTGPVASKHSIILNSPFLSFLFYFLFSFKYKNKNPKPQYEWMFQFWGSCVTKQGSFIGHFTQDSTYNVSQIHTRDHLLEYLNVN